MTNALLIAITAQFIPIETYRYGGYRPENFTGLQGFVDWSLSPFRIDVLFDGEAFPAVSAQQLGLFNSSGRSLGESDGEPVGVDVPNTDDSTLLYLPYANITCLINNSVPLSYNDSSGNLRATFFSVNTSILQDNLMAFSRDSWRDFYTNQRSLLNELLYQLPDGSDADDRSPVATNPMSFGRCFLDNTTSCR